MFYTCCTQLVLLEIHSLRVQRFFLKSTLQDHIHLADHQMAMTVPAVQQNKQEGETGTMAAQEQGMAATV